MFEVTVSLHDRFVTRVRSVDRVTIGRDPSSNVPLPNVGVSRQHAEIRKVARAYVLRDLGSTNGVLLNGEGVTSAELASGDRIEIGKYVLTFRVAGVGFTAAPLEETVPFGVNAAGKLSMPYGAGVTSDLYHRTSCAGLEESPEEHRVFFATSEDAAASGRVPCPTCSPDTEA